MTTTPKPAARYTDPVAARKLKDERLTLKGRIEANKETLRDIADQLKSDTADMKAINAKIAALRVTK